MFEQHLFLYNDYGLLFLLHQIDDLSIFIRQPK